MYVPVSVNLTCTLHASGCAGWEYGRHCSCTGNCTGNAQYPAGGSEEGQQLTWPGPKQGHTADQVSGTQDPGPSLLQPKPAPEHCACLAWPGPCQHPQPLPPHPIPATDPTSGLCFQKGWSLEVPSECGSHIGSVRTRGGVSSC